MEYQKLQKKSPKLMLTRHTFDIRIYKLPCCATTQYLVD